MPRQFRRVDSLLGLVQGETTRHRSNPYQIAKATGLPMRSIQKLLAQSSNPTLRNVEMILHGFGLTLHVDADKPVHIKPALRYRKPA